MFIHNCKERARSETHRGFKTGPTTVEELNEVLACLIKQHQLMFSKKEIDLLRENRGLPSKSKLKSLAPILDTNGLLRVGGRLKNSLLAMDEKHPIILSENHEFPKLNFRYDHIKLYHCGSQLLLSSVRRRFWVFNDRNRKTNSTHLRHLLLGQDKTPCPLIVTTSNIARNFKFAHCPLKQI